MPDMPFASLPVLTQADHVCGFKASTVEGTQWFHNQTANAISYGLGYLTRRSLLLALTQHTTLKNPVGVMLGCCTAQRAVQWSLLTRRYVATSVCRASVRDAAEKAAPVRSSTSGTSAKPMAGLSGELGELLRKRQSRLQQSEQSEQEQ